MSWIVTFGNRSRGWVRLLDGAEDTPLPRESTRTRKKRFVSTILSGTMSTRVFVFPVNQVGKRTRFERFASSLPKVL